MLLYVHIPFCKRKCTYCGFVSYEHRHNETEAYIAAVLKEASLRSAQFTEPVETIYIGGGTPSLLTSVQLKKLVSGLIRSDGLRFSETLTEFSVEANPGTITKKWLQTAKELGINRLSVGVQSSDQDLLNTLGRIHTFQDVVDSVSLARSCGLNNINLDLIFGIPGQTMDHWQKTLYDIIALEPKHISLYGLILEEGTKLQEKVVSGELSLPDPDAERDMYDFAISLLSRYGYRQYEISNFAIPGYECQHNIGYWSQIPYVGLGASAASMVFPCQREDGLSYTREKNPDLIEDYLMYINTSDLCIKPEKSEISCRESRFETIMLSLRMNQGINEDRFADMHHVSFREQYSETLDFLRKHQLMACSGKQWFLTRKGMDIQNQVLLEFMEE